MNDGATGVADALSLSLPLEALVCTGPAKVRPTWSCSACWPRRWSVWSAWLAPIGCPGRTLLAYLFGVLLIRPVGFVSAWFERGRPGRAVLVVAALAVGAMTARPRAVWAGG